MNLLFLHGWAYRPQLWDAVRAELGEYSSSAPALSFASKSPARWGEDMAASLPAECVLVGWSLGAMLALLLARQRPEKIRGLFLIGASPRFTADASWPYGLDAATVAAFRQAFGAQPARVLKRFLALQVLGDARRGPLGEQLEACLAATEAHAELEQGLALLESLDLRALPLPAGLPVRFLHGRQDALMPLSAAQWLAARDAGSRLEIIEDAGHAPLFSQPPALAARIREFVRECR